MYAHSHPLTIHMDGIMANGAVLSSSGTRAAGSESRTMQHRRAVRFRWKTVLPPSCHLQVFVDERLLLRGQILLDSSRRPTLQILLPTDSVDKPVFETDIPR